MNEDFALSLTPANARRLIRIQRACNMILPDDLHDIAARDMIDEDVFDTFVCPIDEPKRMMTQFLLDCDLRGIVQRNYHRELTETAVLNAARLAKPEHIVVFTYRQEIWRTAAKTLFVDDISYVCSHFLSTDAINQYRSGVLIIDCEDRTDEFIIKIRNFGLEFPRTILYDPTCWDDTNSSVPWPMLAQMLFPTMPHALYPLLVENVPKAWADKPLHLFAPLYNVCLFPELITDPQILSHLTNRDMHTRIMPYKHLINI